MASILLRSSILRRSAFRCVLSAAAGDSSSPGVGLTARRAAPSTGDGLTAIQAAPLGRFLHSDAPGEEQPKSVDDEVCKVDQMLGIIEELDQLVERDVAELVELYKAYQTADLGSFERFLTRCGMAKSKSRDDFVWCCQYSAMFGLSVGVGCFLADMM